MRTFADSGYENLENSGAPGFMESQRSREKDALFYTRKPAVKASTKHCAFNARGVFELAGCMPRRMVVQRLLRNGQRIAIISGIRKSASCAGGNEGLRGFNSGR